jgi:hypothetical protein
MPWLTPEDLSNIMIVNNGDRRSLRAKGTQWQK